MKTILKISAVLSFLFTFSACSPPPLDPCPPMTDFSPCQAPGLATCYQAPKPEDGGKSLAPVVGCALPQYDIDECVSECVH